MGRAFLIVVTAVVLCACMFSCWGSMETPTRHAAAVARDDLEVLVARYGRPDEDTSSETEVPRPPMVTRFLTYRPENVRAIYYPDVPMGTPPPYSRWKLMGFTNATTRDPMEPEQVVRIMAGREK